MSIVALCAALYLSVSQATWDNIIPGDFVNVQPTLSSWKAMRDFSIFKQELDYSCGAASLATIFNEFYGMSVTEEDVLAHMGATDRSSFQQLAEAAPRYGDRAGGRKSGKGFLAAVATGAVGGALSPVSGVRSAAVTFG